MRRVSVFLSTLFVFTVLLVGPAGCDSFPVPGNGNENQNSNGEVTVFTANSVQELHDFCFSDGVDCEEDYSVSGTLYLDTSNLPSHNNRDTGLVFCSTPIEFTCDGNSRLSFAFEDLLGEEIDPGIEFEVGWKVQFAELSINYCDTCYTNEGLAQVISLEGSLDNVQFVHDPDNEVPIELTATLR